MTFWPLALLLVAAWAVWRLWSWRVRPLITLPPDRLVCWGHRGMPSKAPENTIPSFEAAIAAGVDGIEIDVMPTADGVLVVKHDFDLERQTDGAGLVQNITYEQLKKWNAAHRWPGGYPAQPTPRLEDVLALAPEGLLINIEMKANRWRPVGIERSVVDAVRQFGILDRTIVSSFNPNWLLNIRRLEPRLALGYLWWDVDVPWWLKRPTFYHWVRPEFLHPSANLVTAQLVDRAHRRGVRVNTWTVNNLPMIAHLKGLGVDGIFTDYPELVHKANQASTSV